jgi:hypothetical protein
MVEEGKLERVLSSHKGGLDKKMICIAISARSQLHACCQVETRRDATLVEMRCEVRAACYRGTGSCYINLPEPWYFVFMQQRDHGKKQYNRNICLIVFSVFYHPVLTRIHTLFRFLRKIDNK